MSVVLCSMQKKSRCWFTLQLAKAKRQYSYLQARENYSLCFSHKNWVEWLVCLHDETLKPQSSSETTALENHSYSLTHDQVFHTWWYFLMSNLVKVELLKKGTERSDLIKETHDRTCNFFHVRTKVFRSACISRDSNSMQTVNLNTASFAWQVKMGLSTIGIHLDATE